ncbi:MAG: tyrosine-type recombinase/integrase [Verrucomicrobia bacterium]|nr:tyrosine-type recombinase/integrase [Verrucomicrobiota bacterium]
MKLTMLSRAQAYLAYRRALGFKLDSEGCRLLNFARYADGLGHRGPLTTELAIRWACLPRKAERLYWARRLESVRRFAKHLLLTEPRTQVPPRHLFGPAYRRNPPHLYSSAEVQLLLRRAGRLKGGLRPRTIQTLVGLLACTGLRISEALNLKTSDVDLEHLVVVVRESKRGKRRLVPLHPSTLPPLLAYARRRQKLFPLAEHFFVSNRGTGLTYTVVRRSFIQLRAGIPYSRRPPRLHDLRHLFACRVLQRWQASKRGAVHRLAILSRFLGHTQIRDTYWYFSAFPQLLTEALGHFKSPDHDHT